MGKNILDRKFRRRDILKIGGGVAAAAIGAPLLKVSGANLLQQVKQVGAAGAEGAKTKHYHGRVTPAERKAAAARAEAARLAAGIKGRQINAMTPLAIPDYFGSIPNWANSPQETIDLPQVVISDATGTGAVAVAVVVPAFGGSAITNIQVQFGGFGYTAPLVTITGGNTTPAVVGAVTLSLGVITNIALTSGGTGYAAIKPGLLPGGFYGMRKFVDALPGLYISGVSPAPAAGSQWIPVGVPDNVTYGANCDYYEISLVQYTQQMHADLPPTTLRGYVQTNTTDQYVNTPHYLGPIIYAHRDKPVRVKFTNALPNTASGGNLFIPMDPTIMGAGNGPIGTISAIIIGNRGSGYNAPPKVVFQGGGGTGAAASAEVFNSQVVSVNVTNIGQNYTSAPSIQFQPVNGGVGASATVYVGDGTLFAENRAAVHLHGGNTPWISDGTPHQWTTPATETTAYPRGVSVHPVPDMPEPGPGSMTFFYTNQQSARLMFYHDHALGTTRLNVYVGQAAGYLLDDPVEQALVNGGSFTLKNGTPVTVPAPGVLPHLLDGSTLPLVIQDKTFTDATMLPAQDPTWAWGTSADPMAPNTGDLWFPHVYMPNQNPWDMSGANQCGRWDYGPYFWPPFTGLINGPLPNPLFGTTPMEGPDNPGLDNFTVDALGVITPTTHRPSLTPEAFMDTPLVNGMAYPTVTLAPQAYRFFILNACNDRFLNLSIFFAKSNTITKVNSKGQPTLQKDSGKVKMIDAVPHPKDKWYPKTWPTDGRDGGVPDPRRVGPPWIQIGTEGGFLPKAVVVKPQPVGYNYNRRDIVVLNVQDKSLFLGPAERADVIVDFSKIPSGSKLILYNDSPAPVPAGDPRLDCYTGDPDMTDTGGPSSTPAGYGPNTRTIMQFQVEDKKAAKRFNTANLQTALPQAFAAGQPKPLVPESIYNKAYNTSYPDNLVRIQDTSFTFTPAGSNTPLTLPLQSKAIQELFTTDYGRMNATLGVEIPFTSVTVQTTIPLGYVDPPIEILKDSRTAGPIQLGDGTQIWKITHNGVDTHAIHFHLFDVQIINRVGWDGAIRPPTADEMGWKAPSA